MSLLCFNVLHCVKLMFLFGSFGKKYMPLILCSIGKMYGRTPGAST